MVISRYNERRRILAEMCAKVLGLKELPEGLRNLAVKYSDLPDRNLGEGNYAALEEMSLLSMGVVYGYGPTLSFVMPDGHTCTLPYTEVIIEELKKCGYVVCDYGKEKPDFGYSREERFSLDWDARDREREAREKVTLPTELAIRVDRQEPNALLTAAFDETGRIYYGDDFSYDVFSYRLYRGSDLSSLAYHVVDVLGYDSPVARRFLALTSHGLSLTHPYDNVNDLESYLAYISQNEFLNDELYYGVGGFYEQVSPKDTPKGLK